MKTAACCALFVVLGLVSPAFAAAGVSAQELLVARRMLTTAEIVRTSDLSSVEHPSPIFPFLRGLVALGDRKYGVAEDAFTSLARTSPRSKVLAYYVDLSAYGKAHSVPLPELVQAFHRELWDRGDKRFVYGKSKAAWEGVTGDPFYKRVSTAYRLQEYTGYEQKVLDRVDAWFSGLPSKQAFDYLIAAAFQPGGAAGYRLLDEGRKHFPNDPALLDQVLSATSFLGDEGKRQEVLDRIAKQKSDLPFFLVRVQLARDVSAGPLQNDAPPMYVAPLDARQLALLRSARWKDLKARSAERPAELVEYFRRHVAPSLGIDIDAGTTLPYRVGVSTSSVLMLLDLSKQIVASACEAATRHDAASAMKTLEWNRQVYRALGAEGPTTSIARMVQFTVVENTWNAELTILKGETPVGAERVASLEANLARLASSVDYAIEYERGIYASTAGVVRSNAYALLELRAPSWIGQAFLGGGR